MKREYLNQPARKGTVSCGFCSTGHHETCHGGYRNGDGSVMICGCDCADSKPEYCHHCHTTDKDNLGYPWLCDDREACEDRLRTRIENSDFYQTVVKSVGAGEQTRPSRSKVCLCCGEATKGGKFLPGHDSKWLNQKIEGLEGPWMPVYQEIAQTASAALAEKFKKRVYG